MILMKHHSAKTGQPCYTEATQP